VRLELRVDAGGTPPAAATAEAPRAVSPRQRLIEAAQHPLVQRAGELFGATPVKVDEAVKRP
jgi:hypothetical protein